MQQCGGDPAHWLTCVCEEPAPSRVGAVCTRDADCESDETCLDGDDEPFLGGTPPVAICSLRCEDDTAVCERRDPPSVCVVTDDRGTSTESDDRAHCLQGCELEGDPDDKCQGSEQERAVCAPLATLESGSTAMQAMQPSNAEAVCRPLCVAHEDCSPDRCNLRTGVCEPDAREGDALGEPCDPSSADPACEGVCVELDGAAFCSHRCWLGAASNCGGNGVDVPRGMCRFPEAANGLIGDAGFCSPLCNSDDDCPHPDFACELFEDAQLEALFESAGVCVVGG